ncbi:hypothetical protein PYCCODRAFT_322814 [Trametes coccinea BRFM310]|uniref:Uncharacterized protein n=1 Tax=Trametes coccinea (strain BRFM310) TaxID=1353009 RepID=A0A1Y2INA5_TRAC3|nr:hypothetical protein PYCCODRAFT_322814 [Trametes coccinea BRFM310]
MMQAFRLTRLVSVALPWCSRIAPVCRSWVHPVHHWTSRLHNTDTQLSGSSGLCSIGRTTSEVGGVDSSPSYPAADSRLSSTVVALHCAWAPAPTSRSRWLGTSAHSHMRFGTGRYPSVRRTSLEVRGNAEYGRVAHSPYRTSLTEWTKRAGSSGRRTVENSKMVILSPKRLQLSLICGYRLSHAAGKISRRYPSRASMHSLFRRGMAPWRIPVCPRTSGS